MKEPMNQTRREFLASAVGAVFFGSLPHPVPSAARVGTIPWKEIDEFVRERFPVDKDKAFMRDSLREGVDYWMDDECS